MDDYEDSDTADASGEARPDEYAALGDARQVMMEVISLVEDLHRGTTKLGDAIAAAGFQGRAWRGPDADLAPLSDELPDITLDDLLTRLAEFSAGNGPHWLHGDVDDIARFNDEVAVLAGVMRPLRVIAQRQRVQRAREREYYPLERALGNGRVGTQLDLMARALRDLEALGPFIQPLTPEEWTPPAPPPPELEARMPADAPTTSAQQGAHHPFTRLRDFAPTARRQPAGQGASHSSRRLTGALALARTQTQAFATRLRPHKWLVVAGVALVLALATGLLSLALQGRSNSSASLAATPPQLAFACAGSGATLTLTLRDMGPAPLAWHITSPAGMSLSATKGTLQPGATAKLTVKVTSRKAAQGTLAFIAADGSANVPYTVRCR